MKTAQLDLYSAEESKNLALAKLEDDTRFLALMRKRARQIAVAKGRVTTDDLRHYAACWGITPRSSKSWGGVFRGKEWEFVVTTPSRWPGNNGRRISVWRLAA